MKKILFLIVFLVLFGGLASNTHAATCRLYDSSDDLEQLWPGFGLPFNVFTATELNTGVLTHNQSLMRAGCPDRGAAGGVSVTFGGFRNMVIYKTVYKLNSIENRWEPVTLGPSSNARSARDDGRIPSLILQDSSGNDTDYIWFEGAGGSIPQSEFNNNADVYYAAYICVHQSNEWKCGCTDKDCTSSNWQIQKYKYEERN